ncbi:hypothetical protein lerEdw1_011178 [Lerista edwardsae]|nr:hypothetical protein lerEdw1_011178 [Lerista edwardsae]
MASSGGSPASCEAQELLAPSAEESPLASALMFSAGVLGNLTALALLLRARARRRARRERLAPFHVLVMALVLTDLLGTCLLSPAVLAAYGRGRTLRALAEGGRLCLAFAFAMSFFGLATMGCLGAMALERGLALGAPYLYARLLRGRRAALLLLGALPALYALAAAFCALPLLGFGRYVQYCPGTWCFIQMHFGEGAGVEERRALSFALLYAALLLLLVLAVLLGNLSVFVSLVRMHRRAKHARPAAAAPERPLRPAPARQPRSVAEELDHLILLAIMTLVFAGCSLPFTVSEEPEAGGGGVGDGRVGAPRAQGKVPGLKHRPLPARWLWLPRADGKALSTCLEVTLACVAVSPRSEPLIWT